jgi:ribosomal protein S18 acetylase RimI-like enzyme
MIITYSTDKIPDLDDVIHLYRLCLVESPRPVDDRDRMKDLIQHASILCTAYNNKKLVGICRALSDFSYVTYISDLAVHPDFQAQHIGKALLEKTKEKSGTVDKIVLLSNIKANTYYPQLGFNSHPRAWVKELT